MYLFSRIKSCLAEHVIYEGEPIKVGLVYGLNEAVVNGSQHWLLKSEVVIKIANIVCRFLWSRARLLAMIGSYVVALQTTHHFRLERRLKFLCLESYPVNIPEERMLSDGRSLLSEAKPSFSISLK